MAGPIRQPIDIPSLERFIASNVPDIQIPITVKQFGYGQSNPTYMIIDQSDQKFVMRKKPPGKLLSKTAHKVDREYRIIHALEQTDVAVPKAYCLCEDDSIVGTPFYIMEFLDGRIFEDPALPGVTPEERTEMWHDAIRTLAKFHRLSPKEINMESYGKSGGFYNRQLKTFAAICDAQATTVDIETKQPVGQIPHYDELVAFFADPRSQPKDRSTLVHGDFKIDNVVFHKTEPRIIGILDWEMSTIGHPLADLVNLLMPFEMVTASKDLKLNINPAFVPEATPGLPPKSQLVSWYADVAGWDPTPDVTWGDAFSAYKLAVIMQGIAARYAVRQASSEKAKEHAAQMPYMGEFAWQVVQKYKSSHETPRL